MPNLVIDIGNSFTKIATFNHQQIKTIEIVEGLPLKKIQALLTENNYKVLLSSVHPLEEITNNIAANKKFIIFNPQTKLPIINNYKTPQTLGTDRLAAVIGAATLYPNTPVLVIDAGTCVTYDFIDADKQYNGGSIAPGLNMRFKAMHTFTKKLPLLTYEKDFNRPYGDDTSSAINSGAINGMYYEICGFIDYYKQLYHHLKIILCGGDASFFDTRLKNSIFADQIAVEPNLVLIGLNAIVNYHNDQNL